MGTPSEGAEPVAGAGDSSLDGLADDFRLGMAAAWDALHPEDLENLHWLAYAYTAAGRHEEALAADLRLVAARPQAPGHRYDLACSYALLRRRDDALRELEAAIGLGFADGRLLRSDDDLDALRGDPRFEAILRRLPATA